MSIQGQPDRITYSQGFKVPGPDKYSSINAGVSYATDVRDGETIEQAMQRARAFVLDQVEQDLAQVPGPAAAPAARSDEELFDPHNRRHVATAERHFDNLRIDSENSRRWFIDKHLPGKPVAELEAIIQQERQIFRERGGGGAGPFKTRSRYGGWRG